MRIVTAREQAEMLLPWQRESASYYHITDNPDFKPDPSFKPENNGTLGGNFPEGLFVSQHPEHWMQGHGYFRPYVSEIDVPDDVGRDFSNSERHIPADQFDKIKVKRTMPVDAYGREVNKEHGWVESETGKDFENGSDLPKAPWGGYGGKTPDYRYPGTAMDHPEEWRINYEQQVRDYQQRNYGGGE